MPALIETAYVEAVKLLNKFVDPAAASQVAELVSGWRPQPDDWERVFMPEAAARARIAYKPLWVSPPPPLPRPGQTIVRVRVAEASEFASGSPRAKQLPGGFASIAQQLVPGVIWVAWEYLAPGEDAGMSYNGLVYLDGRFVWFPKPWKFIDF
ncbi:MAG: hypothetical protein HS111_20280 [Kofleriaceae bacterium]|nr:hypothetical protein [Kofleriaceae bacterium]MCL4225312.1 hypothetical protein [Myxococcales bacterium]